MSKALKLSADYTSSKKRFPTAGKSSISIKFLRRLDALKYFLFQLY